MKKLEAGLLVLASVWLGGCQYILGGLDIRAVDTSVQSPSNVATYISVMNGDTPVTDLTAGDFQLKENGQPLDAEASQQVLLNAEAVVEHRTLLLLDLSSTEQARPLSRAAASLVTRLRAQQGVTVYAFDGGQKLELIGGFDRTFDQTATPEEFESVTDFKPSDGSRNLNGAIVSAIGKLKNILGSSTKPVRVGSLVVFARGPDLAARVSSDLRDEAIAASGFSVYAVGPDTETMDSQLESLGQSGTFRSPDFKSVGIAFENVATALIAKFRSYYLLSYCSPARAGIRRLSVDAMVTETDGTQKKGSWEMDFDSTGFEADCDPKATPRFGTVTATAAPSIKRDSVEESKEPKPSPPAASPATGEQTQTRKSRPPQPRNPAGPRPAADPEGPAHQPPESDDEVVPPPPNRGYAPVND